MDAAALLLQELESEYKGSSGAVKKKDTDGKRKEQSKPHKPASKLSISQTPSSSGLLSLIQSESKQSAAGPAGRKEGTVPMKTKQGKPAGVAEPSASGSSKKDRKAAGSSSQKDVGGAAAAGPSKPPVKQSSSLRNAGGSEDEGMALEDEEALSAAVPQPARAPPSVKSSAGSSSGNSSSSGPHPIPLHATASSQYLSLQSLRAALLSKPAPASATVAGAAPSPLAPISSFGLKKQQERKQTAAAAAQVPSLLLQSMFEKVPARVLQDRLSSRSLPLGNASRNDWSVEKRKLLQDRRAHQDSCQGLRDGRGGLTAGRGAAGTGAAASSFSSHSADAVSQRKPLGLHAMQKANAVQSTQVLQLTQRIGATGTGLGGKGKAERQEQQFSKRQLQKHQRHAAVATSLCSDFLQLLRAHSMWCCYALSLSAAAHKIKGGSAAVARPPATPLAAGGGAEKGGSGGQKGSNAAGSSGSNNSSKGSVPFGKGSASSSSLSRSDQAALMTKSLLSSGAVSLEDMKKSSKATGAAAAGTVAGAGAGASSAAAVASSSSGAQQQPQLVGAKRLRLGQPSLIASESSLNGGGAASGGMQVEKEGKTAASSSPSAAASASTPFLLPQFHMQALLSNELLASAAAGRGLLTSKATNSGGSSSSSSAGGREAWKERLAAAALLHGWAPLQHPPRTRLPSLLLDSLLLQQELPSLLFSLAVVVRAEDSSQVGAVGFIVSISSSSYTLLTVPALLPSRQRQKQEQQKQQHASPALTPSVELVHASRRAGGSTALSVLWPTQASTQLLYARMEREMQVRRRRAELKEEEQQDKEAQQKEREKEKKGAERKAAADVAGKDKQQKKKAERKELEEREDPAVAAGKQLEAAFAACLDCTGRTGLLLELLHY